MGRVSKILRNIMLESDSFFGKLLSNTGENFYMFYCEKCHLLSDDGVCGECGKKGLGVVKDEDFCFLTQCNDFFGEMFIDALKEKGINCVALPYGDGVRTQLGLSLGEYRIFVPYKYLDESKELLEFYSEEPTTDDYRKMILENIDKWNFESRSMEKKIRKKLKVEEDEDIIELVKEKVELAESIDDMGLMNYEEHGLRVKGEGYTLWFSAESYKISI